mmetsp:Transcript_25039/g.24502  ORF Transcript_25039/g.24502 Transcript_25039/m.24502 type:complete len:115 (+) Transcript_25039:669-1013(+)
MPLLKQDSAELIIGKLLDSKSDQKPLINKKEPIDEEFLQNLQVLKHGNLFSQKNSMFKQEMVDKLVILDKMEKRLHMKIEPNLLPKPKVLTFHEQIQSNFKQANMMNRWVKKNR